MSLPGCGRVQGLYVPTLSGVRHCSREGARTLRGARFSRPKTRGGRQTELFSIFHMECQSSS